MAGRLAGVVQLALRQPGDPVVVEDFTRVSGLLRTFAPLNGDQPDLPPGDRRGLEESIAAAAKMTADIGRWNQLLSDTVARMGSARQIYVPAQTLTGMQVTDVDALAEAKLMGRVVPADVRLIGAAGALYARTAPKTGSALRDAGGLTLRGEILGPEGTGTVLGRDPIERS